LNAVPTVTFYYAGLGLCLLGGLVIVAGELWDGGGPVTRETGRYIGHLDHHLRFIRSGTSAMVFLLLQLVSFGALTILAVTLAEPLYFVAAGGTVFSPLWLLERAKRRRVTALEAQLDDWLILLANGLHATPSVSDAIAETGRLAGPPMAEEIDLVDKEVRLGTPLDNALRHAADRIDSASIGSAFESLVVARQTGGDLSSMLEETAGALREMTRLEGVLSAKTAEVRAQAYVLAVIPFVLVGAMHVVDPHWLRPLGESPIGWAIAGVATALWLGAILFARRILAVNL
jgi:tight adherence protein B